MLNKNTRGILKSLLPINNSFIVEYPNTIIIDEFKSIVCKINFSKLESEMPTFGIFDGANFLNALDLMDNPEITLKDNLITAKDSQSTMNFVTSDPASLEDSTTSEQVVTSTLSIDSIQEFSLDAETLLKIKKAAGVFKSFDTLFIKNTPKDTKLEIGMKETFQITQNSYKVQVQPSINTKKEFSLPIPLENILKLPAVDYNVYIKYNESRDAYRVVLQNEIYTFIISLVR